MADGSTPKNDDEYLISGPLLGDALRTMRHGGHVHIVNETDESDRMCSSRGRTCSGYDRIYLEEKQCCGISDYGCGILRAKGDACCDNCVHVSAGGSRV